MRMIKSIAPLIIVTALVLTISTSSFAFGHPHPGTVEINGHSHKPTSEITPLNRIIGLEKTSVFFHAPKDNHLPWGFVEGKILNHVIGYPVIIQFYNEKGEPVHFAQTDINPDGTYEYKFRVRNVSNEQIINIFEGDYTVFIFKVVYLPQNSSV